VNIPLRPPYFRKMRTSHVQYSSPVFSILQEVYVTPIEFECPALRRAGIAAASSHIDGVGQSHRAVCFPDVTE